MIWLLQLLLNSQISKHALEIGSQNIDVGLSTKPIFRIVTNALRVKYTDMQYLLKDYSPENVPQNFAYTTMIWQSQKLICLSSIRGQLFKTLLA